MTGCATDERDVVQLPSCPELLAPQHVTVPPNNKAHEWKGPAVTAIAVRGVQGVGVTELVTFE